MRKRIITFVLLLATLITTFFSASASAVGSALLPTSTRDSFEAQSVTEDLKAVYGENFKTEQFKDVDELDIIHTMEYGYYSKDLSDYGFYIYVYAPIGKEISKMTLFAAIGEGQNLAYMPMFCTVLSSEGNYYKCRVEIGSYFNENCKRIYNLSSLTVSFSDKTQFSYKHGYTYKYTGNMKGYGSPIDTLACRYSSLDVIDLLTNFTYYRTAGSEKGLGWQNQINTVYFSVPNSYLEKYGHISKIHHKYTEYETGPMVVTDNLTLWTYFEDLYNSGRSAKFEEGHYGLSSIDYFDLSILSAYISDFWFNELYAVDTDGSFDSQQTSPNSPFEGNYHRLPFWFYDSELGNRGFNKVTVTTDEVFNFIQNHEKQYFGTWEERKAEVLNILNTGYLLYPFEKDDSKFHTCSLVSYSNFGICFCPKSETDSNYIKFKDFADSKVKKVYEYLFEDKLDEYNETFDLEDVKNIETLLSYDSTHDFWDKVDDFGFWSTVFDKSYIVDDKTVKVYPFSTINDSDLGMSDKSFSDKYFIALDDVSAVKSAYNEAVANDCTLFLFRFDISDYYASEMKIYKCDPALKDNYKKVDGSAMVCMQSYYDDFQIISLTFKKDGVETIIPVNDTPDDFIAPITTPSETSKDKGNGIMALIGLILIAVLVFIFRKPISKFFGVVGEWIINGIKGIIGFIRKIFKRE